MDWSGCYLTLEKRLFLVTADQKQQLPATWCISNCNHRLDESDMTSNALRVIKDVSQSKGEKAQIRWEQGSLEEWMQFTGWGEKRSKRRLELEDEETEGEKI